MHIRFPFRVYFAADAGPLSSSSHKSTKKLNLKKTELGKAYKCIKLNNVTSAHRGDKNLLRNLKKISFKQQLKNQKINFCLFSQIIIVPSLKHKYHIKFRHLI